MIKLNLQFFGGAGDAADTYSKMDANTSNDNIDIKIGGTLYSYPKSLFDNVGATSDTSHAKKMYVAAVYAAYKTATGLDPKEQAQQYLEKNPDAFKGEGLSKETQEDRIIVDVILKNWMAEHNETFDTTGYDASNLYELYNPNKSMGTLPILLSSDQVRVNNQTYSEWKTNPETGTGVRDPLDIAREKHFNPYYNDLYSGKEGTLGYSILDNQTSLFQKEAENARILADSSLQAQAMQQAQTIKQVTDSIRAERTAQLRAGMSESQLADRELQMLMGSVNQMNQQAQLANQDAMAARLAQNTAREQAFNEYIAQTTALGQNAAANYATRASDVMSLANSIYEQERALGNPITWEEARIRASGYDPKKSGE